MPGRNTRAQCGLGAFQGPVGRRRRERHCGAAGGCKAHARERSPDPVPVGRREPRPESVLSLSPPAPATVAADSGFLDGGDGIPKTHRRSSSLGASERCRLSRPQASHKGRARDSGPCCLGRSVHQTSGPGASGLWHHFLAGNAQDGLFRVAACLSSRWHQSRGACPQWSNGPIWQRAARRGGCCSLGGARRGVSKRRGPLVQPKDPTFPVRNRSPIGHCDYHPQHPTQEPASQSVSSGVT